MKESQNNTGSPENRFANNERDRSRLEELLSTSRTRTKKERMAQLSDTMSGLNNSSENRTHQMGDEPTTEVQKESESKD